MIFTFGKLYMVLYFLYFAICCPPKPEPTGKPIDTGEENPYTHCNSNGKFRDFLNERTCSILFTTFIV